MRFAPSTLALLISSVLYAGSTAAIPLTFADRASFDTANQPQNLITFDELSGALCQPINPFIPDPCVFQHRTVTFTSTIGIPESDQRPLLSIETNALGSGGSPGLISNALPFEPGQFFFGFASPFVAFDLRGFIPGALFDVQLTERDGAVSDFQTTGFFGASSVSGFTEVSLFALPVGPERTRSNVILDNLAVSTVASVQEPSLLALMVAALGGMGFIHTRRKRESEATQRTFG